MARITPLHLIPALIAAASHAGEITVEQRPFFIEKLISASAIPGDDGILLKLSPVAWADFEITKIADHASKVKKDDLLVAFDPESIDKKLVDTRSSLESGTLTLAQAENDLKLFLETAPFKLESTRRAAEIAKDENAYFTQVRRKAAEDTAIQSRKRSEQILGNQREELKQLSAMYAADDVTEETEEIILIRQQDAVAAAEFALRMEVLDQKRTLEVSLPREAKALADAERDTAIALKRAQVDIPRSIELKKLEVEALRISHQRNKESLAELEKDRSLFEFKAPADGWFYHGPIENGRWTTGDLLKSLVPHGRPLAHRAFATFVPGNAKLNLVAFLDEASSRTVAPDLAGVAVLAGREDLEIPLSLIKIAAAPGPDGTYRADFSVNWPKEFTPAPGSSAEIRLITYQQASAIVIPSKAIRFDTTGWTVDVKLTDGKTERRPIKRGRIFKDETEILSGLEVGQVVLIP